MDWSSRSLRGKKDGVGSSGSRIPARGASGSGEDVITRFWWGRRARYVETELTGIDLINQPLLNKGTAFGDKERGLFRLHGLLPPHVGTLDEQVDRRLRALRAYSSDFERYSFLRDLQDTNETLFYALLVRHTEEMLR